MTTADSKPGPEVRWSSVTEVATHLGVAVDTVYRWIENKGLPAHRLGRLWKCKLPEVDVWVRDGGPAEPLVQSEVLTFDQCVEESTKCYKSIVNRVGDQSGRQILLGAKQAARNFQNRDPEGSKKLLALYSAVEKNLFPRPPGSTPKALRSQGSDGNCTK